MLGLAVQPPSRTRPGIPLYPPIAVRLSSDTSLFEELSHQWAVVTLVRSSGEILRDKLSGKLADSAHPLPSSRLGRSVLSHRDRAYFYFPDLRISEPGRYKIRVSLMRMDFSTSASTEGEATVCDEVDSRSIIVEDMHSGHMSPRKSAVYSQNPKVLSRLRSYTRKRISTTSPGGWPAYSVSSPVTLRP